MSLHKTVRKKLEKTPHLKEATEKSGPKKEKNVLFIIAFYEIPIKIFMSRF